LFGDCSVDLVLPDLRVVGHEKAIAFSGSPEPNKSLWPDLAF
jgi:hypothetical protein